MAFAEKYINNFVENTGRTGMTIPILIILLIIVCCGIVIYRRSRTDICRMAMEQLVQMLSDGYLVIDRNGVVLRYNEKFMDIIGKNSSIRVGIKLNNIAVENNADNESVLSDIVSAINSSKNSGLGVSYEQSVTKVNGTEQSICYYVVEVNPLIINDKINGYTVVFRDVTEMKADMQKIQENQTRLIENERLAFLGQMVGGIAHNLKTPIMSISGSVSAVKRLVEECKESLGDSDVCEDDYREIYGEINEWLDRTKTACDYMSDIIQTVKGQASNANMSENTWFSVDDTVKQVTLLLRHELLNSGCSFKTESDLDIKNVLIYGDINNLVQVISNLVVNSIDAQKENGNHDIIFSAEKTDEGLKLKVKDYGSGITETVRKLLFENMVTSKGSKGSGLGLYISSTVIKAKFGGKIYCEDNLDGGTVMIIELPIKNVKFTKEGSER